MSSFWSSVKKRKGSTHENPPSGRSSRSASRGKENDPPAKGRSKGKPSTPSRDESADDECSSRGDDWSNKSIDGGSSRGDDFSSKGDVSREGDAALNPGDTLPAEEPEEKQEGCLNMSRIAGQVLGRGGGGMMRVGILPAFTKSGQTGSLPRHASSSSSAVAQATEPTPPPLTPSSSERPAVPESPKPKLKSLGKKRAASASPSREKRRSFRGISRDRFQLPQMPHLPPMPQLPQMKNFPTLPPLPKPKKLPKVPSMPKLPSLPKAPTLPRAPPLPRAPSLPPQLRSFFHRGGSSGAEKEAEQPNKPSRRPGPVGRTWVKVYDDITFMDSDVEREDIYPVLGYTGRPRSVPDAVPLPIPPTPPPPKSHKEPSVESEYDNVPSTSRMEVSEVEQGVSAAGKGRGRDRFKGKRLKRTETPLGEGFDDMDAARLAALEGAVIVSKEEEDDYIIPQALSPHRPPRGHKVYDNIDIKKKEECQEAPELLETPSKPPRGIKVYEDVVIRQQQITESKGETQSTETVAVDAVVKMVEEQAIPTISISNAPTEEITTLETEVSSKVIKEALVDETEHPARPKRGIKVYDTIDFRQTKSVENTTKDTSEQAAPIEKPGESSVTMEMNADLVVSEHHPSISEEVPPRPTRGNKVYSAMLFAGSQETASVKENLPADKLIEEKSEGETAEKLLEDKKSAEVPKQAAEKEEGEAESENKIEVSTQQAEAQTQVEITLQSGAAKEDIKNENQVSALEMEIVAVTTELVSTTEEAPKSDIVSKSETTDETINEVANEKETKTKKSEIAEERTVPLYARVHKGGKIKELRPLCLEDDDDTPPPIPPKKKGLRTISPLNLEMEPPRPPRHLKPRTRKSLLMINGELPARPPRGNKIYVDVEVASPAPPKRHSKVVRIEDLVSHIKGDLEDVTHTPVKPLRHGHGEAPLRRKKIRSGKSENEDDLLGQQVTATLKFDSKRPAEISITTTEYDENYENVTVTQDSTKRSRMRPLPPPPPPPKKGKVQHPQQQQQHLFTMTSSESPRESVSQVGQQMLPKTSFTTIKTLKGGSVGRTGKQNGISSAADDHVSMHSPTEGVVGTWGESGLESDIDDNLKTIECSFAALDNVLKSLQSYSGSTSEHPTKTASSVCSSVTVEEDIIENEKNTKKENDRKIPSQTESRLEVTCNTFMTETDVLFSPVKADLKPQLSLQSDPVSTEASSQIATESSKSEKAKEISKPEENKVKHAKEGRTVYETLYRLESVKKERRPTVKNEDHGGESEKQVGSEDQITQCEYQPVSKEETPVKAEDNIIEIKEHLTQDKEEHMTSEEHNVCTEGTEVKSEEQIRENREHSVVGDIHITKSEEQAKTEEQAKSIEIKPFLVEEELLKVEQQLLRVEEQLTKADQPEQKESLEEEMKSEEQVNTADGVGKCEEQPG
ncbi:hypothetical protein SK128_010185 [Halocaridina rubra]|uniref:Uncharacterized protein n=1 Tax=Halocaridina rubra TaxID=373956 RepID=A0AAN8XHB5_HALRR